MGCWNGTCMISNLPIIAGDKVKLVLLKHSYSFRELKQSGGYVYSNDIFSPSFLPISGSYNDYGTIENIIEDWNYKLVENELKKILGDYIIVDGKKKTEYSLNDIIKGIERNNLRYFGVDPRDVQDKNLALSVCSRDENISDDWKELLEIDVEPKERKYNMSFVMIREDIWNHIIENYNGEFWNHDDEERKNGKYYITAKEWCRYKFNNSFEERNIKDKRINYTNLFNNSESGNRLLKPFEYNDILMKSDNSLKESIYNHWSEFIIINSFISGTRKGWMIQPGAGSQNSDWDDHKLLAEKIIDICDKNLKEYEE